MAKKTNATETPIANGIGYNTIHIFGYGETQLISSDSNKKVATSILTKLQAVIDNVYSKKPADNNAGTEYHAINIFNNMFADYLPKARDEKCFRVEYKNLDATLINELVEEIKALN
jgi:hypothetical protein